MDDTTGYRAKASSRLGRATVQGCMEGLCGKEGGSIGPQASEGVCRTPGNSQGNDVAAILNQRGERYGKFCDHAGVAQRLKTVMRNHMGVKWERLADDQKEALEMIAHKLARIANGDPDYADSWVDIAGYSKLVADRLEGVER